MPTAQIAVVLLQPADFFLEVEDAARVQQLRLLRLGHDVSKLVRLVLHDERALGSLVRARQLRRHPAPRFKCVL